MVNATVQCGCGYVLMKVEGAKTEDNIFKGISKIGCPKCGMDFHNKYLKKSQKTAKVKDFGSLEGDIDGKAIKGKMKYKVPKVKKDDKSNKK